MKTGLHRYSTKGGTGIIEAFHRSVNQLVASVQRLSPALCDQRVLPRVHSFNFRRDQKLNKTSKPSTLFVWGERDVNDASRGCLVAEPFPKAGPRLDVRPSHSGTGLCVSRWLLLCGHCRGIVGLPCHRLHTPFPFGRDEYIRVEYIGVVSIYVLSIYILGSSLAGSIYNAPVIVEVPLTHVSCSCLACLLLC